MASAETSSVQTSRAPHANHQVARTVRTGDGVELAFYHWPPRGAAHGCEDGGPQFSPRATVVLLHGLAEHAGRYEALAARLNAAGIELFAVDLRGHGRSPGRRTRIASIDEYLLDVEALLSTVCRRPHNPNSPNSPDSPDSANRPEHESPLFLMGHSMGGAIAALFAIERLDTCASRDRPLAGLILSSPALAPGRDVPKWIIAISRLVSRIWPSFPAMKVEPALLSRDPAVVEANRRDPLVHHGSVPARTGAEILAAMERIERGRAALRLPVLVYHGSDDKLTEPDGSRLFAAHVGSPDCTLTIYEGSYHETMNDLDGERVIDALIAWIAERSQR